MKLHNLSEEELKSKLNGITEGTAFMIGNGPNYSVRVGRTSMTSKQVAKNIEGALAQALTYVTMHDGIKFSKVQAITVTTKKCPIELPVLNQLQEREVKAFYGKLPKLDAGNGTFKQVDSEGEDMSD